MWMLCSRPALRLSTAPTTARGVVVARTSSISRCCRSYSPSSSMLYSNLSEWATMDPSKLGTVATTVANKEEPYAVLNLVDGQWTDSNGAPKMYIPHPLDYDAPPIFSIPDITPNMKQIAPFMESLRKVPKSGLHNPLKNPHRYVLYGEISRKVRLLLVVTCCCLLLVTCSYFALVSLLLWFAR